jgi:hypothetical protein
MKVDGPVNAIRLEGELGGIDRVLYIFMDHHLDLEKQTECPGSEGVSFINYLQDGIRKRDRGKQYNIYFEVTPTEFIEPPSKKKSIYINRVLNWLKNLTQPKTKSFRYDIAKHDNLTVNLVDMRSYIMDIDAFVMMMEYLRNVTEFSGGVNPKMLLGIQIAILEMRESIEDLYKAMYGTKHGSNRNFSEIVIKIMQFIQLKKKEDGSKITPENISKLVGELLTGYKYPQVKTVVENVINGPIKKSMEEFLSIDMDLFNEKDLAKLKDGDGQKMIEIAKKLFIDSFKIVKTFLVGVSSKLMDVYFIKNYLEGDVTNGIYYCGIAHAMYTAHLLIKHFGFKITHVSHSTNNIDVLNHTLANIQVYTDDIDKILYYGDKLQCSKMTNFPEGFI